MNPLKPTWDHTMEVGGFAADREAALEIAAIMEQTLPAPYGTA